MSIPDIFRSDIRKPIPPNEYWDLVDESKVASLTLKDKLSREQINERAAELQNAETKFGYVHEGELLWLQALLAGEFRGNYSVWVLNSLNQFVVDRPFRWSAYADMRNHTSPKKLDVWASVCSNTEFLATKLVPEHETHTFYNSTWLKLAFHGVRSSPSRRHLAILFERLHNFPYYVHLNREALLVFDETNDHVTEVSVLDAENPELWEIHSDNMYSSINANQLNGRQPLPPFDEEGILPPDPLFLTVRDQLEAVTNSLSPLEGMTRFAYYGDCMRFIYQNLDQLSEDVRQKVIEEGFDSKVTADGLMIEGKPRANQVEVECCGVANTVDLDFRWGTDRNYPEYVVGDSIQWGAPETGYPELSQVLVRAERTVPCPECECDEVLLRIEENKIVGVDLEATAKVTYIDEAPYVQDSALAKLDTGFGVDDLVSWRDFEPRWLYQQVIASTDASQCPDFNLLCNSLKDDYTYENGGSILGHKTIAWLHSKHRDFWSRDHFVRAINYCGANFYCPDAVNPTLGTPVKSMALVHFDGSKGHGVAAFLWGDMLDFQEYQVGDSIRWSEYSLGDPEVSSVLARWIPIVADGLPDRDEKPFLLIENNVVVGFVGGVAVSEPLDAYSKKAVAYANRLPFMAWPDDEVISGGHHWSL